MARTKEKKKRSVVSTVIFYISLVVLLICVFLIGKQIYETVSTMHETNVLKDIFYSTEKETDGPSDISTDSDTSDNMSDFDKLLEINKETIGWLKIPGTNIDTVVLQHPDDSDGSYYYLDHDFYNNYSKAGSLFLDRRNTISGKDSSDNMIIYGHNMSDGTMFSQLLKYKDISFLQKNPIINFNTICGNFDYKIIGCFVTNVRSDQGEVFSYNNMLNFSNEQKYKDFIDEVNARTYFSTGIETEYGDKFLTLSTCTYEFEDARFVVIARQVRDGETVEVDTENIVKNNKIKRPDIWNEIYG